ncbi:ubiquitin protein ligase [Coprinopsis marcescibilis]|uniref:HECT-type E3 ubiquitin transferase n=1 Tax=Coprinopsis marcescibilis TaxID=230819 RepID=A0A5C3KFX8_COPMA|nr:ubiquitin protein ligase [Coprinopsis marcescibilis]
MFPFEDHSRKRKINLGGSSRATTQADILGQVRQQRQARLEIKRREDAAVAIQAWWRAKLEWRVVRMQLWAQFQADLGAGDGAGLQELRAMRCLMLLKDYKDAMGVWTASLNSGGQERVFALAKTPFAQSWLVLVKIFAIELLKLIAASPLSAQSAGYIKLLSTLLSTKAASHELGQHGEGVVRDIAAHLLKHDFYSILSSAVKRIPIESKKSANAGAIISLTTLPLVIYQNTPTLASVLSVFFTHILAIPLLPNRISIASLPLFLSHIPLAKLHLLENQAQRMIDSMGVEDKVHLVANCAMFFPAHYSKLSSESLVWYLHFFASVFNALPEGVFEGRGGDSGTGYDSDGDGDIVMGSTPNNPSVTRVTVVSSFANPPAPLPKLDNKTITRLAKLVSTSHIDALLGCTKRSQKAQDALISYILALNAVWPENREKVLTWVLGLTEGSLIRVLYRGEVRGCPLGKEEGGNGTTSNLFDPKNAKHWTPLLFLCELYAQALVTMGDDEFFGSGSILSSTSSSSSNTLGSSSSSGFGGSAATNVGTASVGRNPLSIDELVSFSRQLLNIAFTLFWTGDEGSTSASTSTSATTTSNPTASASTSTSTPPTRAQHRKSVPGNPRYTWELVRERVTRCLVAIHARDSRKRFVPPGGWLVTSRVDLESFARAAIAEENQLTDDSEQGGTLHRNSRSVLSKRGLAALSPCLGVLNNIPFAIPFETRVSIFRKLVGNDMGRNVGRGGGLGRHDRIAGYGGATRVNVRRGRVAEDGFDKLGEVDLKRPVEITFVDRFGHEEAGIDGGGVFKEFFTDLCKEVFDTDRGLWLANKENELYPNPHSYATESHSLNWYRFIGRVLGKAMYEGILVDVAFAGFFLARWLGKQSFLDDLASLDPELYRGLVFLKHYDNPEELALNFTIAVDELGVTKDVELVPGGSNLSVTKANRLDYITLVSHFKLKKQIKKQSDAFFEGLSEMIDGRWLRMFNQQEVQILIGGVNSPIDLDDLRRHTNYGGLYDDKHPVIEAFWDVLNSFNQDQRRALLRFVTSCSRPPLLGFKELAPMFSIRDAGTDQHRLPTSSTCVNLLKLPMYQNEGAMKRKVLQAIMSNSGFDLS